MIPTHTANACSRIIVVLRLLSLAVLRDYSILKTVFVHVSGGVALVVQILMLMLGCVRI